MVGHSVKEKAHKAVQGPFDVIERPLMRGAEKRPMICEAILHFRQCRIEILTLPRLRVN